MDNLSITILVRADSSRIIDGLVHLLPSKNRPVFDDDEINPEWVEAIELLEPPENITQHNNLLLLEWYETDHGSLTIKNVLEKAGAKVEFIHAIEGDSAAADEGSGEEDPQGYYFLNVDGELIRFNQKNINKVLPDSKLKWNEEIEQNGDQIVKHLITNLS